MEYEEEPTETEDEGEPATTTADAAEEEHDGAGGIEGAKESTQITNRSARRARGHVEFPGGLEELHGSFDRQRQRKRDDGRRRQSEKRLDAERQRAIRARLLQEAAPEEKTSQQPLDNKQKRRRQPGPPAPGTIRYVKRTTGSVLVLGAGASRLYFEKSNSEGTEKHEHQEDDAQKAPKNHSNQDAAIDLPQQQPFRQQSATAGKRATLRFSRRGKQAGPETSYSTAGE